MKNLFDPATAEEIRERLMRLRPESERQWGSMSVAQTLAHCNAGMQMAAGTLTPRRAPFPVAVLGLLIKPLVLGEQPMRRNSPSAPALFPADPSRCELERERALLIAAVDGFAGRGAEGCSRHPHPFLGRLTPRQWGILMYKHLDHHLRQFGV